MEIKIFDKAGKERCSITRIEYSGEWMSECFVTFSLESPFPIEFQIGDWLEYRGERFELHYEPTVTRVADSRTYGAAFKYENVKFISEAEELVNCDFLDYVLNDNGYHYSGLPDFSFYAENVKELANRLQANMDRYCEQNGLKPWIFKVESDAVGNSGVNISISNSSCFDALGLINSEFGLNFIIRGRTVRIGGGGVPADHIFKMGKTQSGKLNGLYEFTRDSESDQKIVTRLRAYGSPRNLPRRYYNSLTDADGIKFVPDNMAVQRLMLPDFPYTTLDPYIDSENIDRIGVREDTIYFDGSGDLEEIYPSIENATAEELKASGYNTKSTGRLDEIVEGSNVLDDGVGTEEDGEIIPDSETFKIRIKDIGFDIMDYLTDETPQISFKSGMLGGRDFEICTGSDTKPVQNADGTWTLTLMRVYDDAINLFFPYNRYNAKTGDFFVILGIDMPEIYIKMSSQRLLAAAKEYLSKNDFSRSIYTPKVDEIFMAHQHQDYLNGLDSESLYLTLKEGDLLMFEDSDLNIRLSSVFIDKLIIKEGDGPVPTFEITLKEEKTVGALQRIQNQIDSIKKGGNGGSGFSTDQIRQLIQTLGTRYFLRKDGIPDTSYSRTYFDDLISSSDWRQGMIGGEGWCMYKDENGKWVFETDNIVIRDDMFVNSLTVNQIKAIGGMNLYSLASIEVTKVEELEDVYRCYFELKSDYISNLFRVDDIGYCHRFTPENTDLKYYKRRIVGIGEDYIDLTKGYTARRIELTDGSTVTDTGVSGSGVPAKGDVIAQYGNYTDQNRQFVIILDVQGGGYMRFLGSLNWVNATGREYAFQGYQSSTGKRWFIGDKENGNWAEFVNNKLTICATLSLQSKLGDQSIENYIQSLIPELTQDDIEDFVKNIVGDDIKSLQDQIDGKIETWFGKGEPTLSNSPANEWKDENTRQSHAGDLYYDNSTGFAYRFSKENGQWKWVVITDDAIAQALAAAQLAKDTADGKRTVFGTTPEPPYQEGDLWVNATYPEGNKETDSANNKYSNDLLRCRDGVIRGESESFNINDWELASKYTDDALAQKAIDEIAGYEYLKKATAEGTLINGGLILTSLIQLGSTDDDGEYKIWSGISGTMLGQGKGTSGIASWYGGDMWDLKYDYNSNYPLRRYAQTLFRFDGSGYLAGNKIGWESDGSGWLADKDNGIRWDEKGNLYLNNGIKIVGGTAGSTDTLGSIINFLSTFSNNFKPVRINGNTITKLNWNEVISGSDYDAVVSEKGFYSESFISAMGVNRLASKGGASNLSDLEDVQLGTLKEGQSLVWNGSKWVNDTIKSGGLDESQLANYLTQNGYWNFSNRYLGNTADFYSYVNAVSGLNVRGGDSTLSFGAMRPMDTVLDVSTGTEFRFFRLLHNRTDYNLRFQGTNGNANGWGEERTLLDSKNYTSYFNLSNYALASDILKRLDDTNGGNYIRSDMTSIYDLRFNFGGVDRDDFRGAYASEYPCGYGVFISLAARDRNSAALMFFGSETSGENHVFVNHRRAGDGNTQYTGWKTIAYTTDNVASANQLANTRYIWGQPFNGTGNVDGKIMANVSADSYTAFLEGHCSSLGSGQHIGLSFGKVESKYNSGQIWHTHLGDGSADNYMSFGANNAADLMVLRYTGNVGIGTTSPKYKLDVSGEIRSSSANAFRATYGSYGCIIRNDNESFYILLTNAGDSDGTWNTLRPFRIANSSGNISFGNGRLYVVHNGNVGIATSSPSYDLHVVGTAYVTTGIWSSGYITAMKVNSSSDSRLKQDLMPLNLSLSQIANAPSVLFRWKKDCTEDFGSIAQYWQLVNPLFANTNNDNYLTLEYGKLALVSIINVAKEVLNDKEKIRLLENRVRVLEEKLREV